MTAAPHLWWPAGAAAYSLLLIVTTRAAGRGEATRLYGVFYYFYLLLSLRWIGNALAVQSELFGAFIPVAVFGLPAVLCLFYAAAGALLQPLQRRYPLIGLTLIVTLAETARAVMFTGFPWNAPAQLLAVNDALLQGLSLARAGWWNAPVVWLLAVPGALLQVNRRSVKAALAVSALTLLGALYGHGRQRLQNTSLQALPITVMAVQHGIPQRTRMQPGGAVRVFNRLAAQSAEALQAHPKVTHVIWPESSLPPSYNADPLMRDVSNRLGRALIAGAAVWPDQREQPLNMLLVSSPRNPQVVHYAKTHLVPFGEYLPFPSLLRAVGLSEVVRVQGGFAAGRERRPLSLPGTPPLLPLICYEAIFADEVNAAGADWMVQITNDSWFGDGDGPQQHLLQARMRAVENGVSVVRAAATGISAVIDPLGRVRASLPLGASGVLVDDVPVLAR